MTGKFFVFDPGSKSIITLNTDGTDRRTLVRNRSHVPDGVVVDPEHRHIYWTERGETEGDKNTGCTMRADLDGTNITTLVPIGTIRTPKQITINVAQERLWWCDREGMRVTTCLLSGKPVTTLISSVPKGTAFERATKDERPPKGGKGKILRAGLDLLPGIKAEERNEMELIKDKLPEPIDLESCEVDGKSYLYWTDRGASPRGNSLNRCLVSPENEFGDVEVLVTGLDEAIGISIVVETKLMYFTDLGGTIYKAHLNGHRREVVGQKQEGDMFTGIWYADV